MEFNEDVYRFCKRALSRQVIDWELFRQPHPYVKDTAFCPSSSYRQTGTYIVFPGTLAGSVIGRIGDFQYTESFHDWPLIKFHLEIIALEQSMLSI